jgi:hypothetical protein
MSCSCSGVVEHELQLLGRGAEHVSLAERADGVHQHVGRPHLGGDPVDDVSRHGRIRRIGHLQAHAVWQFTQARLAPVDRHHGKTGRGESHRRRAAGRTTATGHDRNFRAHCISLEFPVRPLTVARTSMTTPGWPPGR